MSTIASVGTSSRNFGVGYGNFTAGSVVPCASVLRGSPGLTQTDTSPDRHGRHVRHEIVGAVGRDDGKRLAVAEVSVLVRFRREPDDEIPSVGAGGVFLFTHTLFLPARQAREVAA